MSFPATGFETAWRNSLSEVCKLLAKNHGDDFMVWNLTGKETKR